MKVARSRMAQVIADETLQRKASKAYVNEIAAYLLSENRVGELDSLLRDVQADWAKAGHVEVIATSAHPLTASIRNDITARVKQQYPKAKQIIVTEAHDPTVLGGLRLTMADQQIDMSVRAKLNKFKQLTTAGKDI